MAIINPAHSTASAGAQTFTAYDGIDRLSGVLLLAMFIAAPWLFGATENWSVWTLNGLGYAAGLLLLGKWFYRWKTGVLVIERISLPGDYSERSGVWLVRGMGVLTVAVLGYCLVSSLNARATFFMDSGRLEYHERYLRWLPFSYDSQLSWHAFWSYLALAAYFWALRDWLLHPPKERAAQHETLVGLPPRFNLLLWILAINATALALEGTFQRLSGTTKLLWLRPGYSDEPDLMFGPFAFRGNASAFFNLSWPVILGFWWLQRLKASRLNWDGRKVGGGPHIFLLLCAVVTAAAPMAATSRGGTIILVICLLFTLFVFLVNPKGSWRTRCTILLVAFSVFALGGALGWDQLGPRLRELFRTPYANPNELYAEGRQMANDYPLFGIGPGAFRALYHMYREDPAEPWQAFLHDDWLETRVTFGWAGAMLILSLLGLALSRWFAPGGLHAPWELVAMLWVSVGGCLAYAKFSFPLQVYSILLLFLTCVMLLTCFSRPQDTHT